MGSHNWFQSNFIVDRRCDLQSYRLGTWVFWCNGSISEQLLGSFNVFLGVNIKNTLSFALTLCCLKLKGVHFIRFEELLLLNIRQAVMEDYQFLGYMQMNAYRQQI